MATKEQHLLSFLHGEDKNGLLALPRDSNTRKYGELAVLTESAIAELINLNLNQQQDPTQ